MAGGDENSSMDMGAFVAACDDLKSKTRAHIEIIHHAGKDAARGARGHSLLRAATDTELEIVTAGARRGLIRSAKQRDIASAPDLGFALRLVTIHDGAGRTHQAAVADIGAAFPAPTESAPADSTNELLRAINAAPGVTQGALAETLERSKSWVSKKTAELQGGGLIVKLGTGLELSQAGRDRLAAKVGAFEPVDETGAA